MTGTPLPRPRQATVSGGLIMVGSVLIVLLAFQQVSTLGSIEAQESAEDFLSRPPGDGLGIGVDDVQTILRVLSFVAAAVGTATAILGWQVLQRVRSARLALSVLAPVLLVSGLAPAGFSSALVAAAVVMLWVQPTRDWFDGKAPAARPVATAVASYPLRPPTGRPLGGPSTMPPPTGPPLGGPGAMPPPQQPQSSWTLAPPSGAVTSSSARPSQVVTACIVAIVGSAVAFAGGLVMLLFFALSREEAAEVFDSPSFDGYSTDSLVNAMIGFLVVVLVWSLIAIALAVATMSGSNVARILLVVSSVVASLVSLLGLVTAVLIPAMIVTVVMLLRRESQDWFTTPR